MPQGSVLDAGSLLLLALFLGLLLSALLCGLAASGHFPPEHRSAALRSPLGSLLLFGSLILCFGFTALGAVLVAQALPWYALVIGSGAVMLATPLLLRPFPDTFVNGPAALASFSAASGFFLLLIWAVRRTG